MKKLNINYAITIEIEGKNELKEAIECLKSMNWSNSIIEFHMYALGYSLTEIKKYL